MAHPLAIHIHFYDLNTKITLYCLFVNIGSVDSCHVITGQKDNIMLVSRSKAKSAESEPFNCLGTRQSRYSCKLHNVIIIYAYFS